MPAAGALYQSIPQPLPASGHPPPGSIFNHSFLQPSSHQQLPFIAHNQHVRLSTGAEMSQAEPMGELLPILLVRQVSLFLQVP